MIKTKYLGLFLTALCAASAPAQTIIDSFEYASSDDLVQAWEPSDNAIVTTTDSVAPGSTGKTAMQVQFNFVSSQYATERITGKELAEPVSISPSQYLSFRVKGDPAFKSTNFRNLYLYVSDGTYWGRWGAAVPTLDDWQVFNFLASDIEKPWDSDDVPDLTRINRFAFYQYGSGETAVAAYSATIAIDDLTVRDTPLIEAPTSQETVVENFEYATSAGLQAAWTAVTNAVISASDSIAPLSSGKTSIKLLLTFPTSEWSSVAVSGPALTNTVPIGSKQYITLRIKGDPAFAAADFRTFYVYAYDTNGNFGRWGAEVPTNSDWQILNLAVTNIDKPWDSPALPNLSAITRFGLMQYGSEKAIAPYSATIYVDDIMVRNSPLVESGPLEEKVVEDFEYASSEDLTAQWIGSVNTVADLSQDVDSYSPGKTSMQLQFNFASYEWSAESIIGPTNENEIVIGPKQYVSFRVKGDPAFSTSDFHKIFLYAYDTNGNFGRWGDVVPATNAWQNFNFLASTIEKPWDSTSLPDLNHIIKFAFFQYGSAAAIDPYTATVYVDDIMIRNTPFFENPSKARELIDDFESYTSTAELESAYSYVNSPADTTTAASLATPAAQGNQALKLEINFAAGQYPWGSILSAPATPFAFPTNAVVTLKFKGDPSLASIVDEGSTFWLSFYDTTGRRMDYRTTTPVASSDWVTLQASLSDFDSTSAVDVGNLTQWRILVQAREGKSTSPAITGTFYVDDIQIAVPTTPTIKVVGTAPNGLTGTTITGIVLDEVNKTVTADLPKTGQGFLTISPAQTIKSVTSENGKLVIRW
jgi:hypothetical protein